MTSRHTTPSSSVAIAPRAPMVSVVVPVYNEAESVHMLHKELVLALDVLHMPYELIFVNDGSTDHTASVLASLYPIEIVHLPNNKGQSTAMREGIRRAKGSLIVTLDGDGQNPPYEIPRMVRVLLSHPDVDVLSGWRKYRHDTIGKRIASRTAYSLRQLLFRDGIRDAGCSLRVYRRHVFDQLPLAGELHRFMLPMIGWNGYSIAEMVVQHRSRKAGTTKYNWKRGIRSIRDMFMLQAWRTYKSHTNTVLYNRSLFGYGVSLACATLGVYHFSGHMSESLAIGLTWMSSAVVLAIASTISMHLYTHSTRVLIPEHVHVHRLATRA